MKDIFNEIETRKAVHNGTFEEKSVTELFDQNQSKLNYFILDKFPKEFKKSILKSVDIRFFAILFISLVFHVFIILFLEKKFPVQIDSRAIIKIQQQYVDLLLEDKSIPSPTYKIFDAKNKVEPIDYEVITGLKKWVDMFGNKALESINNMPIFSPEIAEAFKVPKETMLPSKEEIGDARKSVAKARSQFRTDLEKEVSTIGLLGLISRKTSLVDYDYIDDLLGYADLNEDNLGKVLSELNSIQVPRHNTAGYILSFKKNADIWGGKLKGGREYADNEIKEAIKNIEPLESAKTSITKRVIRDERVPSSALTQLRAQDYTGKTRSAKDVMRVVQSHKRALQDCYKQELKVNPTISGKITIRFVVDPNGNVVEVSIVSSTLNSQRMKNCIVNRISNWKDFGYSDPSVGNVAYKQVFNFGQ